LQAASVYKVLFLSRGLSASLFIFYTIPLLITDKIFCKILFSLATYNITWINFCGGISPNKEVVENFHRSCK